MTTTHNVMDACSGCDANVAHSWIFETGPLGPQTLEYSFEDNVSGGVGTDAYGDNKLEVQTAVKAVIGGGDGLNTAMDEAKYIFCGDSDVAPDSTCASVSSACATTAAVSPYSSGDHTLYNTFSVAVPDAPVAGAAAGATTGKSLPTY